MKTSKIILGLFILIILTASASYAQQQFVQTVTAQNTKCNSKCSLIDAPGLNNNPAALIFLANGANQNANLIGALYRTYEQKWSIFYSNGAAMQAGTKFNLDYYTAPDANHFVYVVSQPVHSGDDAIIDRAGLNNNPNAQPRIFPTNPTMGNALFNPADARAVYVPSVSKWVIVNNAGGNVPSGVAYNVAFSNGGPIVTNDNANKTLNTTPKTQVSTSPTPVTAITNIEPTKAIGSTISVVNAGGDLSGYYPNPTVIGLQGKPLSNVAPTVGQILKWNGAAWEPATDNVATAAATSNTPTPTPAAAPIPAIQTFFKKGSGFNSSDILGNAPYTIPELTQTIVLNKKSRLIISQLTRVSSNFCTGVGCNGTSGAFDVKLNGNGLLRIFMDINVNSSFYPTLSNFMVDLDPGTYTVTFVVSHPTSTGAMRAEGIQSSVMVIPLE